MLVAGEGGPSEAAGCLARLTQAVAAAIISPGIPDFLAKDLKHAAAIRVAAHRAVDGRYRQAGRAGWAEGTTWRLAVSPRPVAYMMLKGWHPLAPVCRARLDEAKGSEHNFIKSAPLACEPDLTADAIIEL